MEITIRRGRRVRRYEATVGREQVPGAYTPAPEIGGMRFCEECHARSKEHTPRAGSCVRGGPGVCMMCRRPKPVIYECSVYDFRHIENFDTSWIRNHGIEGDWDEP